MLSHANGFYTTGTDDETGTPEISRKQSVVGGLSGMVQSFMETLNRTVRMRV